MKRFIILCFAIVAVLTINACEKLPDGTGTLKVEVSGFYYENNVRIYPYGLDDYAKRSARKWQRCNIYSQIYAAPIIHSDSCISKYYRISLHA